MFHKIPSKNAGQSFTSLPSLHSSFLVSWKSSFQIVADISQKKNLIKFFEENNPYDVISNREDEISAVNRLNAIGN